MISQLERLKYILICLLIISAQACIESRANRKVNTIASYVADSTWNAQANQLIVSQPTGIGIDKSNHIFVFQRTGRKWVEPFPDSLISVPTIFEIDAETGKQINAWGANHFVMPHGLMVDQNNHIWVTDVALHQVFKFSHDGKLLLKLGVAREGGNDSLHFNRPTDVTVDKEGFFYVSDGYRNSRVVKFSPTGKYIKEWGTFGNGAGQFNIPHGLAIDDKDIIYVADRQNNRIQLFDTNGNYKGVIQNDAAVQQLPSLAIDLKNKVFAIDYDPSLNKDSAANGSTFFECDARGSVFQHFGLSGKKERKSCWFHDIAVDKNGNVYVGDITGLKLLKFRPKN
ncbi:peptidyl-alpha-hydroxyglycine alpha-amidating lyase family protein [Sediminibacterium sp. TEGAF015]|uniref:peptidyl-alpha-hydroxyglycine alpha-amidating lyase family protein n=1 Tax=Sediminibacterium sp. TEGAF015 TaxID=575378 RepID=UPI0021FE2CA1|nr:peptidyl-alpha-hydroxyglycine alpha-amidating lyase family protein [Sediminibacterium sp. TEGAF015]BDQ12046.1 hypothetical protein TEGAF0_12630 [Sediminibacterium sp. TEGAF015]